MEVNLNYNELKIRNDIIPETKVVPSLNDLQDIESLIRDTIGNKAMVVIWLMNKIVWTSFENGHIDFAGEISVIDYWQEMRAFNAQGEVQLVRAGDGFTGRTIVDREETANWKQGYVDSISPIWGENDKKRYENGRVHLADSKRKIQLDIPVSDGGALIYGLVTRSYIFIDETTGLSGYGDYRFLAVEGMKV